MNRRRDRERPQRRAAQAFGQASSTAILKRFLPLCLGALALVGLPTLILYRIQLHDAISALHARADHQLEHMCERIDYELQRAVGDLLFLSRQSALWRLAMSDVDATPRLQAALKLMAAHGSYLQLQVFDRGDIERLRFDLDLGRPIRTAPPPLGKRMLGDPRADLVTREPDRVVVSGLTLRIDQGALVQPPHPILRIGMPMHLAGVAEAGVVMLTLDAGDLLRDLATRDRDLQGEAMLLNSDGYWILAPEPADQWGHMMPGRAQRSFDQRWPGAWARMHVEDDGRLRSANGLFSYSTIDPEVRANRFIRPPQRDMADPEPDDERWILVSHIPERLVEQRTWALSLRFILYSGAILLVVLPGAWVLAASIARREACQQRLRSVAEHDSLTGLVNHALFLDRLGHVQRNSARYGRRHGLLCLNLDNFDQININHGHQLGDALLAEIATRLKALVRKSDTVARVHSDELAIVLSEVAGVGAAKRLGDRLVDELAKPIRRRGVGHRVGVSIGAAVYPEHGQDVHGLMAAARGAMRQAKARGKGRCIEARSVSAARTAPVEREPPRDRSTAADRTRRRPRP